MHFSIPEVSEIKDINQGTFKVYHLHANGILHCKLRFRQFNSLHEQLKKQFGIFSLPFFPPKKLFALKENEIEERRALLEKYMQIISQDERISDSDLFNDFLLKAQQETLNAVRELVKLDVLLADNSRITCQVMSTNNSNDVKEAICRELKLQIKYTPYFSLFIVKQQSLTSDRPTCPFIVENGDKFIKGPKLQTNKYTLIRKMTDFEAPYLSLRNANQTNDIYLLKLIKFYWDLELDQRLVEDDVALNLIYLQAVNDFERHSSELNQDHYRYLESLAHRRSKKEYIIFAKNVKHYGRMCFEECICDFPKPNTSCFISINNKELILRTLLNGLNNKLTTKEFILRITRIRCWRLTTGFDLRSPTHTLNHGNSLNNNKNPSFTTSFLNGSDKNFKYELSIEYLISKDDLKWIVIKSEQAVLMSTCLKSVIEELVLKKKKSPLYDEKSSEISINLRKNSCNYYKSNDQSINNLNRPMEKSLSVETFLVCSNNKSKFIKNNSQSKNSNHRKLRALVQNSAYDGIGDDDL